VDYTGADATYPLLGTEAGLDGSDVTALLRYRVGERVSVYGGFRVQKIDATLTGLPLGAATNPYALSVGRTQEYGYVVGAAYEIPDIALRVALTYNSAIDHDFESTETAPSFGGTVAGSFTTTIPQSVNLEFQTGIAEDTLLFGSVRWQDWSEFDITPPSYTAATGGRSLIDYQSDYTTYTIGVGRRFNETWSGAVTLAHEPATGDIQGNLAPRDGFTSLGVAATYRREGTEITAGVRYIRLGDATTQIVNARFEDNDAPAFGLRLTQRF
jgi:long-subunit fatty acid transport protein